MPMTATATRLAAFTRYSMPGWIDGERARLSEQQGEAEAEVERIATKLDNAAFREKAPAAVVAKDEERLAAARARLEGLRRRLEELE